MTTAPVPQRWHRLGSELREARLQELEQLQRQRYTLPERVGYLMLIVLVVGVGAALAVIARMILA